MTLLRPTLSTDVRGRGRHRSDVLRMAALVLALGLLGGCDSKPLPVAGDDPWPLHLPVPGILGYVAGTLDAEDVAALVELQLGSAPLGLAGGRVVAMALDPLALSGAAALVLPVQDEELFLASLELMPQVESIGDGRYRLALAADSGLAMAITAFHGFTADASALGMLGAMGSLGAQNLTVYIAVNGGRVYVVPTFEGAATVRRAEQSITGLGEPQPWVASLDMERFTAAYRDALESTRQRILGAMGTMRGLAETYERGEAELDADEPGRHELDFFHELIANAPIEGGEIAGLQLRVDAALKSAILGGGFDPLQDLNQVELRFDWLESSSLGAFLKTLQPVPEDPSAEFPFMLRLDPDAATTPFEGVGPGLAALHLGVSEEAMQVVTESLSVVLAEMDGLVALGGADGDIALLILMRPGATLDWDRLADAFSDLASAEGNERIEIHEGATDVLQLRSETGGVLATLGTYQDVGWVSGGDRTDPPVAACIALRNLSRARPVAGPVLRYAMGGGLAEISVERNTASVIVDWEPDDGR